MSGHGRRYVWSAPPPPFLSWPDNVACVPVFPALCSVCPGEYFAIRMLFTTITCTIATFDIKNAVDEHGIEITPNPEFNPGIIM